MHKRKIESVMAEWKSSPNHNPLVIKGCRQCGKTSSVLDFAKKNYKNVVYLDFFEHEEYKLFFEGALDVDTLLLNMSMGIKNAKFVPNDTCIIFDEIQSCPRARSSLKFFKLDGRFDVICTGSLLGVNGYKSTNENDQKATIPVGYEHIVTMRPMDFEEWLWANGITQQHIEYMKDCFEKETPINKAVNSRMKELLKLYAIVGGMPDAVNTFLTTNNIANVQKVQKSIIESYKADMLKYASQEDKSGIRECFESIPAQLAKDNKKFQYSTIRKKSRAKDYCGSLQWIEDAGIINKCYNLNIPELPLAGQMRNDCFKVYMADIGLLVSMLEEGTAWCIMTEKLHTYKGAIYENLAADMFSKMGRKLYYYQKDSSLEIDFVIRHKGNCVPVECKAKTGNAKSLKTLLNHPEKYHITSAIKLGDYNIGRANSVLTLPFYLAFLLTEY
ncbi:MAG: ATP-binding protein [Muribaculaceae bacterium]